MIKNKKHQNPNKDFSHFNGKDFTKRYKKVFPSDQVLHLWANQAQPEANSANVFFVGDTVYSYGLHYKLGRIHTLKNGKTVALVNSTRYSATTAKHQSRARQAVSHLPMLTCPDVDSLADAVKFNRVKLNESLEAFFRQKRFWSKDLADDYTFKSIQSFNEFCRAVGKSKSCINLTKKQIKAMVDHIEMRFKRNAELDKGKEARKALANEKRKEKASEEITAWINGGPLTQSVRDLYPQIIRVKGKLVETSRGAQVNFSDAADMLQKIIGNKVTQGDSIGGFEYTSHNESTVKIGCHVIDFKQAKQTLSGGVS